MSKPSKLTFKKIDGVIQIYCDGELAGPLNTEGNVGEDTFGTLVPNDDGSFTWTPAGGGDPIVIPAGCPCPTDPDGNPVEAISKLDLISCLGLELDENGDPVPPPANPTDEEGNIEDPLGKSDLTECIVYSDGSAVAVNADGQLEVPKPKDEITGGVLAAQDPYKWDPLIPGQYAGKTKLDVSANNVLFTPDTKNSYQLDKATTKFTLADQTEVPYTDAAFPFFVDVNDCGEFCVEPKSGALNQNEHVGILEVGYALCESRCGNVSAPQVATVQVCPPPIGDITVNKEMVLSEPNDAGEYFAEITYTIANSGDGNVVAPIVVTDALDNNLDIGTISASVDEFDTTTFSGQTITNICNTDLAPTDTKTYVATVQVVDPSQTVTNNVVQAVGDDGTGKPTVDSDIDEIVSPPAPTRVSVVDDSDLLNVVMSPAGSLNCEGNPITDFTNQCATYPLYFVHAKQTMTDVGVAGPTNQSTGFTPWGTALQIDEIGAPQLLCEIKNCGGTLTFDWGSSVFGLAAVDQTAFEALISAGSAASGEITFNKWLVDNLLKGKSFTDKCRNANGVPLPKDASGGVLNSTGINYLDTVVGCPVILDNPDSADHAASVHCEGAVIKLDGATVEDVSGSGPCNGIVSAPEEFNPELYVCKGIKRLKHNSQRWSTAAVGSLINFISIDKNWYGISTPPRNSFVFADDIGCGQKSIAISGDGTNNLAENLSTGGSNNWYVVDIPNNTVDYDLPVAPYNAVIDYDAANEPTSIAVPAGVYNPSDVTPSLNGMYHESSALMSVPRVPSTDGGTTTTNPIFGHVFDPQLPTNNFKQIPMRLYREIRPTANVAATGWTPNIGSYVSWIRDDASGDLIAYLEGKNISVDDVFWIVTPKCISIETKWTIRGESEVNEDPTRIYHQHEQWIVETF